MTDFHFGGVFSGKRVLVTGHTGFKGSWLALWLSRLGAEVHGYALPPTGERSLFRDAGVESCLASQRMADVRDTAALTTAVREIRPDFVFHLAAQSLVRPSYQEPRDTYDVNVMGTVNLLEAVRATDSVRVCQVVTSDKCYENREWVYAYRENDPMGGHDPYSSSKACAELVVSAYRSSFFPASQQGGPSLSSVRAGNVIGGGDWAVDRIIPDCVRALEAGVTIPVRNPDAIRPWQHVLEPLSGYLYLAAEQWSRPEEFGEAWNFGPTGAGNVAVREIVALSVRAWGGGEWRSPDATAGGPAEPAPHEARFLKLDITKTQNLLGWRPVFAVEDAVAATISWYRERGGSASSNRALCVDQINQYAARAAELKLGWAAPAPGRM